MGQFSSVVVLDHWIFDILIYWLLVTDFLHMINILIYWLLVTDFLHMIHS